MPIKLKIPLRYLKDIPIIRVEMTAPLILRIKVGPKSVPLIQEPAITLAIDTSKASLMPKKDRVIKVIIFANPGFSHGKIKIGEMDSHIFIAPATETRNDSVFSLSMVSY